MAEFTMPSDAELAAITSRTTRRIGQRLLAVSARYDRRAGLVMIALNNGAVVGFPLSALPGLEDATPAEPRRIEIEGGGHGLRVASLDADISIPQLLADELGSPLMTRTVARANASRANGRLGGRPRAHKAA